LLHFVTHSGLGFEIDIVGFMPLLVVYATPHPARVDLKFSGVVVGGRAG
jgi:hypothetical protein